MVYTSPREVSKAEAVLRCLVGEALAVPGGPPGRVLVQVTNVKVVSDCGLRARVLTK